MTIDAVSRTRNVLITAMSETDRLALEALAVRVTLERNMVLTPANQPIEYVYFPDGGIVSVVSSLENEGRTEVGIFGREGLSGLPVVLGADRSPHEAFVQVGGAAALRIAADDLRALMDRSDSLRALLLRWVHSFHLQVANSSVSHATQRMEARLARWLLMAHDRVDDDEVELTHEFMAMMITAQRSGVTLTLHVLEGEGLIRSLRGRVVIVDRAGLRALAGDTYGVAEADYSRLIAPFGRSPAT